MTMEEFSGLLEMIDAAEKRIAALEERPKGPTGSWANQVGVTLDDLQSRVAALEAQAKAAAEVKPSGDVQALRAMAVKLSRQLAAKRVARRSDANRAYWLKTFAAAALPTAMLQASTTRHAAQLAADTAFELLQIIEQGIDQAAEESDDEREKPETAE